MQGLIQALKRINLSLSSLVPGGVSANWSSQTWLRSCVRDWVVARNPGNSKLWSLFWKPICQWIFACLPRFVQSKKVFNKGHDFNIYKYLISVHSMFKNCVLLLQCTVLHCIALNCNALHCTALHCTALHCTALHCTALHCTALHWTALQCTKLHCTALHCSALHCTALHCSSLQCSVLSTALLKSPILFTLHCPGPIPCTLYSPLSCLHSPYPVLSTAMLTYPVLCTLHCTVPIPCTLRPFWP